jgi:thioredoxin 1
MLIDGDVAKFTEISKDADVLIDFWAPWCHPCKAIEEQLRILNNKYPDLAILRVNVDENAVFASEYYVRNIPTMIWVRRGDVPQALTGFHTADAVAKKIGI